MSDTPAHKTKWRFTTPGEDVTITLSGLAAAGIFLGAAAAVFGPFALGIAAGHTVCSLARSYAAMFLPGPRAHALKALRNSIDYREVPADSPVAQIVAAQSARLGLKEPPPVFYTGDRAIMARLPWWARRTFDRNPKIRQRVLEQSFAAVPGLGVILTTGEALAQMTDERLAFITAHEIAHLRKDRLSLTYHVKTIKDKMTTGLAAATVLGLALPFAGIALPVFTGTALTAGVTLCAAAWAAGLVNNIGMRALERRADRNALYLQQAEPSAAAAIEGFKAARVALEQIHTRPLNAARKEPIWNELSHTHPSQWRRDAALKKAFAKVLRHAAPEADAAETLRVIDAEQKANPVIWWKSAA